MYIADKAINATANVFETFSYSFVFLFYIVVLCVAKLSVSFHTSKKNYLSIPFK